MIFNFLITFKVTFNSIGYGLFEFMKLVVNKESPKLNVGNRSIYFLKVSNKYFPFLVESIYNILSPYKLGKIFLAFYPNY